MVISADGDHTTYEPFAASRAVYPDQSNPSYDKALMRRETRLQFPTGMDEQSCRQLAVAQLQRFADPGFTGTLTLRTDVFTAVDRRSFPRILVRAGQSILVRGIRGDTTGTMFHITESSVDFTEGTTTVTLDSKFRDQLTVAEVRSRTRDALTPLRMLQTGQQSVTINDLMKPWSYAEGSGMLPRAAKELFNYRMPTEAQFPWEEWTRKYPPKNPDCAKFYVRIPPARHAAGEARYNWSGTERDPMTGLPTAPIAIYMAQMADIRLSQVAAYDRDGNVMKVRFHAGDATGPSTPGRVPGPDPATHRRVVRAQRLHTVLPGCVREAAARRLRLRQRVLHAFRGGGHGSGVGELLGACGVLPGYVPKGCPEDRAAG
jgi:hypothetical protein